jgi:hypothetical protein
MVYVALAFNFNIQRCEVEVGEESTIIRNGYLPLVDILLRHEARADLFISGYSTRTIQSMEPQLIEIIKSNLGKYFMLGTYTYTHPIPQLLSEREFDQQLAKGLSIDEAVFEIKPSGFLPPEFAYNEMICRSLEKHGIRWMVVLAKHLRESDTNIPESGLFRPQTGIADSATQMTVVPASYQLPGSPERFFKLMMKGELPVESVVRGVKEFATRYPNCLLLFKRDAETVFIDSVNSGFANTRGVLDRFVGELMSIEDTVPINISEAVKIMPPTYRIKLGNHLGNTKLETFTHGAARPIWELTQYVRGEIEKAELKYPGSKAVTKAWEHLLLSHNSDGRIGYWFSEWNPGEHKVAASRRQFIKDNLLLALESLKELPE